MTFPRAALAALAILYGCIFQGGSETETLSGAVFDPAGNPVPAARVKVIPVDYDPRSPDTAAIRTLKAGSNGRFRIVVPKGPRFNLIATDGGRTWAYAESLGLGMSASMTLKPAKMLKAIFHDSGISDSGTVYFPGTDLLARAATSDTAVLDSVPAGVTRVAALGGSGWRHDTVLALVGTAVTLYADEIGIIISREKGVDCIPQPGEDFDYPLNTLLSGPGIPAGSAEDTALGWTLLFDGRTRASFDALFANWVSGDTANTTLDTSWFYSLADSAMATGGTANDIRSERKYRDFDLRFSYRAGKKGALYKMLTRGDYPWRTGAEFAMDDDVSIPPKTTAGALFDMFAPDPPASKVYLPQATGRWNFVRIVAKGDSVEHWLNNVKVVAYRFWDSRWNAAIPGGKWAGSNDFAQNTPGCKCPVTDGYIGFQGVDGPGTQRIRNLRITGDSAAVRLGPVACPDGK